MIDGLLQTIYNLKRRADEISYDMIEAEGDEYEALECELEELEVEIDEQEESLRFLQDEFKTFMKEDNNRYE